MSRALTLGNGRILICLDEYGQLRDFYYPYIGLENHAGNDCVHRLGISIDGEFGWLDDPAWQINIGYEDGALISGVRAVNKDKKIEIAFVDTVLSDKDAFIRSLTIYNRGPEERNVKVFFHQQFRIGNACGGDTAFFDPERDLIVHYRRDRVFAIGALNGSGPFREYSIGNFGIEDKEGVWKDAEDSHLEGCAAEHGPVDSILACQQLVPAGGDSSIDYWLAVGGNFSQVYDLSKQVSGSGLAKLTKQERAGWQERMPAAGSDFVDLESEIIDLYQKSLLVIRSHTGVLGEIIASGDSGMYEFGKDTYAYVWTRDASFIALALDKAGLSGLTGNYGRFCGQTISEKGYFYHKYMADGSVGSSWHAWVEDGRPRLAIQEEETALPVYWLYEHYSLTSDKELLPDLYVPLVKKAADFMCSYRSKRTGLPLASFDIWEQDYAASAFGCSAVYAGLTAAAQIADLLGKKKDAKRYAKTAEDIKQAITENFYNPETDFFYKSVRETENGLECDGRVDMSSFYGIFNFRVLEQTDVRLKKAYKVVLEKLYNQTPVDGVARYEGDEFFRVSGDAPANPWFITTCWKAQYDVAVSSSLEELARVKDAFWWMVEHATASGMMSEQVRSDTGEQVSASPLAWSHAEYVSLVASYVQKYKRL